MTGDRHVLRDRSDFQRDVQRHELLRADGDALRFEGLVSRDLGLDGVGAWRDRWKVVLPDFVGDDLTRDVGRLVGERDRHAWDDAVGVLDRAANTAGELLGAR